MRKVTAVLLLAALLLTALPVSARAAEENCPCAGFSDVDSGSWYHEDLDYAVGSGLMKGCGGGLMRPEDGVTRAQLWVVLARAAGADTEGGAAWYEKAVQWAVSAGISDGVDPDAAVTREEALTAIWAMDGSFMSDGAMPFTDAADIAPASLQAVIWAAEQGIAAGFPDGTLRPGQNVTRAQLAAMVRRYLER